MQYGRSKTAWAACAAAIWLLQAGRAGAQNTVNVSHDLVRLGIAARDLVPNDRSLDARPLLQAAIDYAQRRHVSRLVADPGAYYVLTPQDQQAYLHLANVTDLTIDLGGATVYLKGAYYQGIAVTWSARVTLTNFAIDYVDPPYTQVELTGIDADARTLRYRTTAGWADPQSFSDVNTPFGPLDIWSAVFRDGAIVPGTSMMRVQKPISGNTLTLLPSFRPPWTSPETLFTLRAGDTLVVTARGGGPPLLAWYSDAIVFSHISVYGSGNWAVSIDRTTNSTVEFVSVRPRPGSGLIGSDGDGIHLSRGGGNNHVRNCYVARTFDDGIAIDALDIATLVSQPSPRRITVKRFGYYRFPNGTPISFVDPAATTETVSAVIVDQDPPDSLNPTFGGSVDLILDRDMPALATDSGVAFGERSARGGGSTLEDNIVDDIVGGRGIWVSGSVDVTVARNILLHTASGGIVISQDTFSFPGPPAHDVVLDSNVLLGSLGPMSQNSGSQTALGSIEIVSTDNRRYQLSRNASNSNVAIRNNYVADSGRTGIWVGELDGGDVSGNVIVRWNRHPELPMWGMGPTDSAIVSPDFAKAVAVHFSNGVALHDEAEDIASRLTGAVILSQSAAMLPAQGGSGELIVQSNVPRLTWAAQTDASWLTITAGQQGSGTDRVQFKATANAGAARTATITIAGEKVVVAQSGS